jgi:hypothetical protein
VLHFIAEVLKGDTGQPFIKKKSNLSRSQRSLIRYKMLPYPSFVFATSSILYLLYFIDDINLRALISLDLFSILIAL